MNVTWSTTRKATATAMGAIAVAAFALGCGAASATKAGKANGPPVVLQMANGSADLTYEPAVAYFANRVSQRSGGRLRINDVGDWGQGSPGFEQQIVRDVARDKADLGWVGTRIFDTLGVRSFQALTAPMLIDSYPLEQAVVESELVGQMLKGLKKLNVTGLSVLSDGLRKPIAVKRPLLGPADWRGVTFAVFRSRAQAEAIRALGARPSDLWGPALTDDLSTGKVQGFEKNLLVYQINGMQTVARYVTVNVNLWPQTVALIGNPHRLAALTDEQQGWLQRAAADAAAHSTSLVARDARTAAIVCKQGARLAYASKADLAALRQAFAPVYATLEQDSQTKAFIAQIEHLKSSMPARPQLAIPAGCTSRAATAPGVAARAAKGDQSVLDGVYRIEWTEHEFVTAGTSKSFAYHNFGVVTLTMRGGRFLWRQTPGNCAGTYAVSGATISIKFTRVCSGSVAARWSLSNGQLRLHVFRASDTGTEIQFGAKSWKKIG